MACIRSRELVAAHRGAARFAALFVLVASFAPSGARAEPADKTEAPYLLVRGEGSLDALPLKETRADVAIAGVIARVRVTQLYENAGATPLEAEYVFPASTRAAVSAMRMKIGARTIEAKIEKRSNARALYDRARSEGKSASLLEEERPNVFKMNVANILPGDHIEVVLDYSELLVPENGVYELVCPTVVGPRYLGPAPRPDAHWAKNLYLSEGSTPPYKWGLSARVSAGMPVADVSSPSHRIVAHFEGTHSVKVDTDDERGGDRDFILRYRLGGSEIETGVLLYPEPGGGGHFVAMIQPPTEPSPAAIPPREYVFIVDVSGSMSGFPIETARELMRSLLKGLRSQDLFNLILFSGGSTVMSDKSLEATDQNIERAAAIIDSMHGGGGTALLPALERALALPRSGLHSTTIAVITDGFVGVEKETFQLIRKNLGRANLFAFGIGTSVNRALIEAMARAGLGEPFIVSSSREAEARAASFRRYIDAPLLTNVRVSFEGFEARDVEPDPSSIADLFASRPIVLAGRYRGAPAGRIVVRGENASGRIARTMNVADHAPSDDLAALRHLWARARLERLGDDLALDPEGEAGGRTRARILDLGLSYGLLTSETSFVAIDSLVRSTDGRPRTVRQPLPLPRGVSNAALGEGKGFGFGAGTLGAYGPGSGGGGLALHSQPLAMRPVGDADLGSKAPPAITGSLDKSLIQSAIQSMRGRIRRCYEQRLEADPSLSGRIIVALSIGPDGRVLAAKIDAKTLEDAELERCILSAMRSLRFPPPAGGGTIQVRYPFVFAS
jgi:Ca-activated chloride channel homolog